VGTATASTNSSGVATFSGLGLSGTAGSYTLTFTAGALSSPTSNSIALSAGGASQITYNQQPSSTASSGQAFTTEPILLLRDASNNPISGTLITATITGAPAGVALIGTVTATTNGSGVATFVGSGLGLSGTVGSYTLTFTAGAVTSPASDAIALAAGTAHHLTLTTEPGAAVTTTVALSPQPVIQLRDAHENVVSQAGVSVLATLNTLTGAGTLGGTVTLDSDGSGVVTFTDLAITGTGTFTITFSATGLTGVTSITITVSP
jgi:hypothetical protein